MLDSQQGQFRAQWPAPGRPQTGSQREGSGPHSVTCRTQFSLPIYWRSNCSGKTAQLPDLPGFSYVSALTDLGLGGGGRTHIQLPTAQYSACNPQFPIPLRALALTVQLGTGVCLSPLMGDQG